LAYLAFSSQKHSPKTFQEKKALFKRFFRSINKALPANALMAQKVLSYLQSQSAKRSGYAANKDRKNLVAAWNWGIKYFGLPNQNPCLVDRFPEERTPRYIPPEEDFWKVYEQAQGQDRVMLLAYLHLAARRSELFRLKWEDVDFSRSQIRLASRKRRDGSWKTHWLPMTPKLSSALLNHRQAYADQEFVFIDPHWDRPYRFRSYLLHELCRKAGVKFFGFHAIRHLTASLLAKAGVPMITIQQILRHESLATTERYLHSLGDLKRALESIFS
jgi:integrase